MAFDGLFGSSIDDPRTTGLLQLAASLSSNRNVVSGLANGLLGRQQIIAQAADADARGKMRTLELEKAQRDAQREQAIQAAAQQSTISPAQQALMGGGPTQANADRIPQMQGGFDWKGYTNRISGIDPMLALQIEAATRTKTPAPIKIGAGEVLLDPLTNKPIYSNPKEDSVPSAVKEYQFAVSQGYPGSFQEFQLAQKRAGATNVSVSSDKGFGEAFAKDAASFLGASRDRARGAAQTLSTLDRADQALNSGNVITGPGANVRTTLAQVGNLIGVGGKDNDEKLSNTRQLLQSSAALAVDGAQALAGQGQITDKERDLVNRMAGGNLESMTVPEIKRAIQISRQINARTIESHNAQLRNVDPKFSPYVPFYQVNQPQQTAPAGGGFPGVDTSAIEAELRRRGGR